MKERIGKLKGKLIVSCQALPGEPLHSPYIMGRMALAAKLGGAAGIRANTAPDITEIKTMVDLPVIGIVKRNYPDSVVHITPTLAELAELAQARPDIIALEATGDLRPGGVGLEAFYRQVRDTYPSIPLMADCSTVEEAVRADELGFDFIGTTMVGYTVQSRGDCIEKDDFRILRTILERVEHPVIAEGNINTPEKARRVIDLGAFCVVVGSAITRPHLITKSFAGALERVGT